MTGLGHPKEHDLSESAQPRVAVVIPCFRVSDSILDVIAAIDSATWAIYCVDDACPDHTGARVEAEAKDSRVRVLYHETNKGVGGAVMTGYTAALEEGADIIVKIDGDGQMDPAFVPRLIRPIAEHRADYAKGNRFYNVSGLQGMPTVRLVGNAVLSFMTKLSSGYWQTFDPTNGFTAVSASVLKQLNFKKISQRYFFESDMLFHLYLARAVVADVPMKARYEDENSNMRVLSVITPFLYYNARNFFKRFIYTYFLRDFNIASIQSIAGLFLFLFGVIYGGWSWTTLAGAGETASAGTVMVSALPIIIGFQMILAFLSFDIQAVPRNPVHPDLVENAER